MKTTKALILILFLAASAEATTYGNNVTVTANQSTGVIGQPLLITNTYVVAGTLDKTWFLYGLGSPDTMGTLATASPGTTNLVWTTTGLIAGWYTLRGCVNTTTSDEYCSTNSLYIGLEEYSRMTPSPFYDTRTSNLLGAEVRQCINYCLNLNFWKCMVCPYELAWGEG